MSLRFGTDGVRGVALTELTPAFVTRLGWAAARTLGGGPWLVGRDTRESGSVLADALAVGLARGGAVPTHVGVVPTPALAWLGERDSVPSAMVTASHNPWHDNGVKVFAAGGTKLNDQVEREIEALLHSDDDVARRDVAIGESSGAGAATDRARIAEYVAHLVETADRLDGLRIVLDCANGATSGVAAQVFRELGASVVVLHAEPDGRNINDRCGATDTAVLCRAVVEHGANLGLAFDGDGDRVIAVDDTGAVVDGDRLLALAARHLRAHDVLRGNTVVVTVMSNLGFHRAMAQAGINVVTTAVGDRYVLEALDAGGFSLGGEQSGHIIYRDLATTGDGILAGLELAATLREEADGQPLSVLAQSVMTTFPQVLVNVRVRERHPHAADELADEIRAVERRLGSDGRVLVRASGTEPLVRVMVEAADHALAQTAADELAASAHRRFG